MHDVRLRAITGDNWRQAILLEVDKTQTAFVPSNLFSLAQAVYEPGYYPCGVYHEGKMIGFVMYRGVEMGDYTLWYIARFMIDRFSQGQGLGRATLNAVLRRLRNRHSADGVLISYVPGNTAAKRLYTEMGFVDESLLWDDEICLVYRFAEAW